MRGNVAVVLAVLMLGAAGAGAQSEDPAEDESAEPIEKRLAPSLLTEVDQACRADPLPNFRLSKSGSSWSMSPAPNLESGNRDHVIYAVGQKRILTRVSSQTVAVRVSWSGENGSNILTDTDAPGHDHVIVGLKHRAFYDDSGSPTGNAFVGVTIGQAGPCRAGLTIEWKAADGKTDFASKCHVPPAGTTSLSFKLSASSLDGCATLDIYDQAGSHRIADCKPDLASVYTGAGVAAIGGARTGSYSVRLEIAGPSVRCDGAAAPRSRIPRSIMKRPIPVDCAEGQSSDENGGCAGPDEGSGDRAP